MRRKNLILIIAGLLFIAPFLGVPNAFQDAVVSILSLLIIVILVFSKYLEGSIIKRKNSTEFDESLPVDEEISNDEVVENEEKMDEEFNNDEENQKD